MRVRKTPNKIILPIIVLVSIFVCLGVGIVSYKKGKAAGQEEIAIASREAIEDIIKTVEEKSNLEQGLNKLSKDSAEDFSGIDAEEYKNSLEELIAKTNDEEVKSVLNSFLEKFKEFEKTFQGGDSVAIDVEFDELKKEVQKFEESLNEFFHKRLENAIEKIPQ